MTKRAVVSHTGKQVLLWMRGRSKSLGELLDAAPFSTGAKAAAEEAIRAVTSKPLRLCGQEAVGAALQAGGASTDAVAAAMGISTQQAARLLGF